LALFYGTLFGLGGTYLPFFPVWLQAVGIDAFWIGIIVAVPSVARFTILPFVTGFAERRQALREAMILTAVLTTVGFLVLGTLRQPVAVLIAFVFTASAWTPMIPLTDGYALKGVARYGLNYGPLRLWGSAAFVAGALGCGVLAEQIPGERLIWVIVATAGLGAVVSFRLRPLDAPTAVPLSLVRARALLKNTGFWAIIIASALIQGSHAAYYAFSSIAWQGAGLSGTTIAGLWALGVIAEIVVFALSPRFILQPTLLVVLGALSAVLRWLITAQDPPLALLAAVQLLHGLSFGLTQLGTMGLLVRHVPGHVTASAQGYLSACGGLIMSCAAIASGMVYARHGDGVYYVMAAMALAGAAVMLFAQRRLDAHHAISG
jgi:PPP family 3-phenylpropionic acid transporter